LNTEMVKIICECIGGIATVFLICVLFNGWPSFVTHNHITVNKNSNEEDEE